MPDFSLAALPNFAQSALSGYQAGAALGKQNQLDSALGAVDLARPETIVPVLRADPTTGAALLGASQKMADAHREAAGRHALASVILGSRSGGGDPSASAQAPTPAATSAATTALTGSPTDPATGDIVVTGTKPAVSTAPAWSAEERAAIEADPHAFLQAQAGIGKLQEAHLAQISDAADAQAAVSLEAGKLPYAQRKAFIAQQFPYLMQHGVTQATIDAFDPTDQNLSSLQTQALGVKDTLAQRDKDRTFAQTVHHQGVEEAQGAARIGLEGQSVAIAGGHLAIARNADARAAATAAAKPSAAPTGHYEYRIVNGVTQRRLVK